jgi:hypothetical protein
MLFLYIYDKREYHTKMHVDFDPVKVDWGGVFSEEADGGSGGTLASDLLYGSGCHQYGRGGGGAFGYTAFAGMPYQRGAGVGAVFRTLMRYLVPIGKRVAGAVGREGLETGSRVLNQFLDGKDLKETMVHEGKAGLKNLLDKAAQNVDSAKKQQGSGFDFKRYKRPPVASKAARPSEKSIKRLHSLFGPPMLPNKPLRSGSSGSDKKRGRSSSNQSRTSKAKRQRSDTLGTY